MRAETFGTVSLQRSRGFTLIEVLAALIIVSLGMLGVIQAVGQTASNSTYLRDKTIAHWIAMNKLTEVRLQRNAPKVDKSSDEVEMAGRTWRWTMEVAQTPVDSIRRIDIKVRAEGMDEKTSLASMTGFYGTAIAPPGSTLVSWQGQPGDGGGGPGGGGADNENPNNPRNPGTRPPPQEPVDPPTEEPPPPNEDEQ